MFASKFWKLATERAIKSGAQALIGLFTLDQFNVLNADWALAGGVAAGAIVLSYLTSMVSAGVGEPNSPNAIGTPE